MQDDDLLDAGQVAKILRVGRQTVLNWAAEEWGPRMIDLTAPGHRKRILRWRRSDVLEFLERRTQKGVAA